MTVIGVISFATMNDNVIIMEENVEQTGNLFEIICYIKRSHMYTF